MFFFLLGWVTPAMPDARPMLRVALSNVAFFIFCAGFFAGFYIIPLQALLQKLSRMMNVVSSWEPQTPSRSRS